jgi:hypothetical protein
MEPVALNFAIRVLRNFSSVGDYQFVEQGTSYIY